MARAPRSRIVVAGLLVATIAAGLASRRFSEALPAIVARYAGDTLWASMVYALLALLWPRAAVVRLAATSLAIAFAVEVSQLYRAPWLDAVRATRVGALVLGQGFLWSDLVCYAAGVVLAAAIDREFARDRRRDVVDG